MDEFDDDPVAVRDIAVFVLCAAAVLLLILSAIAYGLFRLAG
jgi:hypothetical protein